METTLGGAMRATMARIERQIATNGTKRKRRSKDHRRHSLESGPYRVAPSLRNLVNEVGRLPYRDDVSARVQAGAVYILRKHGGPIAMAKRSEFCLTLLGLAKALDCEKWHAVTVIKYLEGSIIERVRSEEKTGVYPHPRPKPEKQQLPDGSWINKPTLWRFTTPFLLALNRLHGFRRRRYAALKSDICRSNWKSFLGKYEDEGGLANLELEKIERYLPMSELDWGVTFQPRSYTRPRSAPPTRVATPCSSRDEGLDAALQRVRSCVAGVTGQPKPKPAPVAPAPAEVASAVVSAGELALARLRRRSATSAPVQALQRPDQDDPRLAVILDRVKPKGVNAIVISRSNDHTM